MGRLIINNVLIELKPSKPIARTLQVNDIANIATKQANFTSTFSIPRTANNIRAFNKLGVVGVNSVVPYQRNNVYYYDDNGECLIYNGWAIVTSTGKEYKCNLYDGIIDLYKAIEKSTLSELDLSELNHHKNLTNVLDSFNDLKTYKYIVADYNGKALFDTNKINIDYLVPSAPVSYIWQKIFDFYGFEYEGEVFNTWAFQNLYMIFPKGIDSAVPDNEVYKGDVLLFEDAEDSIFKSVNPTLDNKKTAYLFEISNTLNDLGAIIDDRHFKPTESGNYRIEISAKILGQKFYDGGGFFGLWSTEPVITELWLAKNSEGIYNSDNVTLVQKLKDNITNPNININVNTVVNINDNESICFVLKSKYNETLSRVVGVEAPTLDITKVESQDIDFEGALVNFKTKDFVNEILNRFALTPFKNKYTNVITFKSLSEMLQDTNTVDWSDKFQRVIKESYVNGSYAQTNNYRYKYNDKESDYYDSSFRVNNINLKETKDLFKSGIYAPEKLKTNELPHETNVYKLWDKEVKDGGSVTYKPLDKRYYFVRYENKPFVTQTIGSEELGQESTISSAPFESFYRMPFSDILQDNYSQYYRILDNAKIIEADIYLKDKDVADIDFSKMIYIKQLSSYFLLNKIKNYRGNGVTKCELTKVDYVANTPTTSEGSSFAHTLSFADTCFTITNFGPNLVFQSSTDGGVTWTNGATTISESPSCGYTNVTGDVVLFRIINYLGEVVSNTIAIDPV